MQRCADIYSLREIKNFPFLPVYYLRSILSIPTLLDSLIISIVFTTLHISRRQLLRDFIYNNDTDNVSIKIQNIGEKLSRRVSILTTRETLSIYREGSMRRNDNATSKSPWIIPIKRRKKKNID